MVYRITVDGKKTYAETPIFDYSRYADVEARNRIRDHIVSKLGATDVEFDTTFEEACELHEKAGKLYDQVMEFLNLKMTFPEPPWGVSEMGQLMENCF